MKRDADKLELNAADDPIPHPIGIVEVNSI
jgi:hypothetical protein